MSATTKLFGHLSTLPRPTLEIKNTTNTTSLSKVVNCTDWHLLWYLGIQRRQTPHVCYAVRGRQHTVRHLTKPEKGRSRSSQETVTRPTLHILQASGHRARDHRVCLSLQEEDARQAMPLRINPGKVSASDGLTLDLCNPCARIQRQVSLSDSPCRSMSRPFSNLAGKITPRWLDTARCQMFNICLMTTVLLSNFSAGYLWASEPDSKHLALVIQQAALSNLPTNWSKGQCDDAPKQGAGRVYGSLPSWEPISADNSYGSGTSYSVKHASLVARKTIAQLAVGVWLIDLLRGQNQGIEGQS